MSLYLASESANTVSKLTYSGSLTTFSTTSALNNPTGAGFDSTGLLYISNYSGNNVITINAAGTLVSTFASGLSGPYGMANDGATGSMVITNMAGTTVVKAPFNAPVCTLSSPTNGNLGSFVLLFWEYFCISSVVAVLSRVNLASILFSQVEYVSMIVCVCGFCGCAFVCV